MSKIELKGNSSDYLCYKVTIDTSFAGSDHPQLPRSPLDAERFKDHSDLDTRVNFYPIKDPNSGEKYLLIHKDAVGEMEKYQFGGIKFSEEPISEQEKNDLLLRNYLATQRDLEELAGDIHEKLYHNLISS